MNDHVAAVQPENGLTRLVPGWIRGYRLTWLSRDLVAGIVIWSVVVPQAVAYAQIAGLPPQAGLIAAPGALLAYGLLGTSRTLVVSATTASAAVSAAAVGSISHGDSAQFAALSAAFALVAAVVLAGSGVLRLGGVIDLISKPVMTGFLFGLGLTIAIGQLPKLLGVQGGSGDFFKKAWAILQQLGDASGWTILVGAASIALLAGLRRWVPAVPAILAVLVIAIVVSSLVDLKGHGVDVVGKLPSAYPQPAWPDVSLSDMGKLFAPAFGILLLTTEGFGVARTLAARDGSVINSNRELVALAGSNALAGISGGFVQLGGSSQTMAARNAGGKSQLAGLIAAALILLTGVFLYPVFTNLPQATLGAIVIVAVAGFFRVDELRRFGRIRQSALVLSLTALFGVLLFGVLAGLIIAAVLSLIVVIQRLSRPQLALLGHDPTTGVWARLEPHPQLEAVPGAIFARVDGPLFYANAINIKERLLAMVGDASVRPSVVVLDLSASSDLDVEAADTLAELQGALAALGTELRLATVRTPALTILRRSGLAERIRIDPTLEAAAQDLEPPTLSG